MKRKGVVGEPRLGDLDDALAFASGGESGQRERGDEAGQRELHVERRRRRKKNDDGEGRQEGN